MKKKKQQASAIAEDKWVAQSFRLPSWIAERLEAEARQVFGRSHSRNLMLNRILTERYGQQDGDEEERGQ